MNSIIKLTVGLQITSIYGTSRHYLKKLQNIMINIIMVLKINKAQQIVQIYY